MFDLWAPTFWSFNWTVPYRLRLQWLCIAFTYCTVRRVVTLQDLRNDMNGYVMLYIIMSYYGTWRYVLRRCLTLFRVKVRSKTLRFVIRRYIMLLGRCVRLLLIGISTLRWKKHYCTSFFGRNITFHCEKHYRMLWDETLFYATLRVSMLCRQTLRWDSTLCTVFSDAKLWNVTRRCITLWDVIVHSDTLCYVVNRYVTLWHLIFSR